MRVRAVSKYFDSSSRTSSASRLSDSGVTPTRSQKSPDVIRRSATGAAPLPSMGGDAATASAVSRVPHSEQNRPDTSAPQRGQVRANAVPHSEQNRAPGDVTVPQAWQLAATSSPLLRRAGALAERG